MKDRQIGHRSHHPSLRYGSASRFTLKTKKYLLLNLDFMFHLLAGPWSLTKAGVNRWQSKNGEFGRPDFYPCKTVAAVAAEWSCSELVGSDRLEFAKYRNRPRGFPLVVRVDVGNGAKNSGPNAKSLRAEPGRTVGPPSTR